MSDNQSYPGYTGNAASQRQHISLLPVVNQTAALARFFGSTVDPAFQAGDFAALNAYVGSRPSYYNAIQDFYLAEPDEARTNYQLEPAMIGLDTDGALRYALSYPDLLGYLQGQGATMGQDNRMFEGDVYAWAPPVDLDKLTNYHQYYWFGDYSGGRVQPVLTLTAPTLAFTADGATTRFALPQPVAGISTAQETVAVYVNSVKVSGTRVQDGFIVLPLAPAFADQVVTTRHDDLTVAVTGAPVGAPVGALVGAPAADQITGFALAGFVDPALPHANTLTSGMRIDLQDTLRIFNAWSSEDAGANGQTYYQRWDEPYVDADPPPPPHDQALWDGVLHRRFMVDGVGQSIRLTPDAWLNRALDPQYVTIDRASVDQNPWSLSNNWVHKDSFAWSGMHFANRTAQRPIVEFIRDIELYNYGSHHGAPVDGVLSSDTARLRLANQDETAIKLEAIAGQPLGSVSVDAGRVLFAGMRLLVAQKTTPTHQLYQVGQRGALITLTKLAMTQNEVLRITHASGYGPKNTEMWFNGTVWTVAQRWRESAGEATDPRFKLYDLNGMALDDPYYTNSTFAGSRIFGYALGSSRDDPVLHRPLQYDNNGAIVFENDVVTRRAARVVNTIVSPISGLYCYEIIGSVLPVSLWHRTVQPTHQDVFTVDRTGHAYYTIPLNLAANPGALDVSLITRSDWVLHFGNIIAHQTGFPTYLSPDNAHANAYADNNWRDSLRDISLGTDVLQHAAPLLKLMLLASEDQFDYFAAVRYVENEYNLFRSKFARKLIELDRKGAFPSTVRDSGQIGPMTGAQIASSLHRVLTDLKLDRSASFPFALSTMAATAADRQFFIPATPSFLGLLPVYQPGLVHDDLCPVPQGTGVLMIRGHDGSLTPAHGDWRDAILLALEQQIHASIPGVETRSDRPVCDLAFYCAGRFCPAPTGTFATADPSYTAVSYRRGEIQAMLAPLFERWALNEQLDYRANTGFVADNPFTWNYRGVLDRYGSALPGHWKAIFRWYFDTERPHSAPWEMLGFADPPSWWSSVYGPAPYTADNRALWDDLEAGRIQQGPRAGLNLRYARPGLSGVIPVDRTGRLRDPIACAIVPAGPSEILARRAWVNGDGGPVENAWITSPAFRFALAQIGFLAKPARWVESFWDTVNVGLSAFGDQWIDHRTQQRPQTAATLVHGEHVTDAQGNESRIIIYGIQQWLVDYLRAAGKPASLLGNAVRGLDVRLLHRMAGFVTPDDLTVVADNFGVLPREDTQIMLYTAPSTTTEVYSGVVIEYVGFGPHNEGPGWRVIGYDARDPSFTTIPPDLTGAQSILSLAGAPEPVIVEWHPNTYFRQDIICAYQGYTYRAVIAHLSGPSFEPNYWSYEPTAYPSAPRVVHYRNGLSDAIETVAYGTVLLTIQQVADFLWSYERWLLSRGWRFVATDANATAQTWTEAVREFLIWTQVRWTVGNFIALSPGASRLHFTTPIGMVMNVENNDTGYFGLLDRSGGPIAHQDVHLSRLAGDLTLQADQADIFAARVRIVTVEHALVFDNQTIFNDAIYLPLFNMRQARLKLLVKRTTNWSGRLDAPGFIVTGATLMPSFERNVEDIRLMFDIEQSRRADITDFARHNINYQARDYLGNLLLSEIQQFEFYQGMIQQKGSPGVFEKLLRSARVSANSNIVFLEEFALRQPARFGGPAEPRISFRFPQSSYGREPQFIRLGDFPATDPTWIILARDDPRWIDPPPASTAFFPLLPPLDPAAKLAADPASARLAQRVPDAGPVRLSEVDYTVFRSTDLAAIYHTEVASGLAPFVTGQRVWIYDAPFTRTWDVQAVFDLGPLANPTTRTATVTEDPGVVGVRLYFAQPHHLTHADQGKSVVVAGAAYCTPEIAGVQILRLANTETNWIEIDAAGTQGYDFTLSGNISAHPQRSAPVVRSLQSVRFATVDACLASPLVWPLGTLIWIDADATQDHLWSVYQLIDPALPDAGTSDQSGDPPAPPTLPHFSVRRLQPPRIDPGQIALSTIYDSATKITTDRRIMVNTPVIADLVIIDPLAGYLPGVAMREISVQSEFDPAKYTSSLLFGGVVDAWGADEVGRIWWDLSTVRYLDPYTDRIGASTARDLAEINYHVTNWAQIAPATSVDVYEWVQSDVPPDQYSALAAQDTTGTYPGRVYNPEAPAFARQTRYSAAFGRDLTYYYFWVSGLTTVPNQPSRKISASAIATILQNPTAQDIPWFAPIMQDGMLVSGVMPYLNDTSTVLQVQRRTGADDSGHNQWLLMRPNDPRSVPPDWLWRRLGDSLAGFDPAVNLIPDPTLPSSRATGIQPGQSLFQQDRDAPGDRLSLLDARESFVGIVNRILAATPGHPGPRGRRRHAVSGDPDRG
jgi:hypothetical protein